AGNGYACQPAGYPDNLTTRGATFTQWLGATTGATIPWTISAPRYDISKVLGSSVRFAYSSSTGNYDAATPVNDGGPNSVVDFTFDWLDGSAAADASSAGRVMYTDMHLSESKVVTNPPTVTVAGTPNNWVVPVFNTSYTVNGGAHMCTLPEAGLNMQGR